MSHSRQLIQPFFVAWLVFLLAGVPLPVTHCHGFEMGNQPTSGGLQFHLCDCSHDFVAHSESDPWHVHWVSFHFTDELASVSTPTHLDVVSNATTTEIRSRDCVLPSHDRENGFVVWLSRFDGFETGIGKLKTSFRSGGLAQYAKSYSCYCATSSRLLL